MKIINQKASLEAEIKAIKVTSKTIGFVPTMGALHKGHLKLVKQAVAENDICVVSIFVNPTQFNNVADLEKYPRNLERDTALLQSVGCELIFAPDPNEIYASDEINRRFDFDFN